MLRHETTAERAIEEDEDEAPIGDEEKMLTTRNLTEDTVKRHGNKQKITYQPETHPRIARPR